MKATQELIAAALTECDLMTGMLGYEPASLRDLREACARAMVQPAAPEMAEVHLGMEGWKGATIAWEVCASIHREYAKKKDPFFTTRQSDFVKNAEAARAKALAPAPDMAEVEMLVREYGNACRSDAVDVIATGDDPESCGAAHAALLDYVRGVLAERDQFRDAAKMVPEPSKDRINPYRNADSGLYGPDYQNQQTEVAPDATVPAEVPMPESDYRLIGPDYSETVWNREHMRDYGDAREAAGVVAGGKDADRYRWLRNSVVGWYIGPAYETHNDVICKGEYLDLSAGGVALDSAIDAALRGEVKP